MQNEFLIKDIRGREILDSRGNPTVEVDVILQNGAMGRASVPSGASTGIYEAYELRDGDKSRYLGKGVLKAVHGVNTEIANALKGADVTKQEEIDRLLISLDGTANKSRLGANAILGVSLACAKAAAEAMGVSLFRYMGGDGACTLPVPMMNILNGGAHADNNVDIQEFMIVPHGADCVSEAIRMGAEVYYCLKKLLAEQGLATGVGDEGGFAPSLENERVAIELILKAIEKAGFKAGEEISLALDVASSEWYDENEQNYLMPKSQRRLSREELSEMLVSLVRDYPIISIEDGMAEDDVEGWRILTDKLTEKVLLVGDDLFVTNKKRLMMGKANNIANSILIKPNQIGTLSEVIETVEYAKANGYRAIMSHRSGETADTFIADLAVALGTDLIKTGAPARSERTEKYNRLMKIERELFAPTYAGESL